MWNMGRDMKQQRAALVMGEYAADMQERREEAVRASVKFSAAGALFVGAIATLEIVILGAMLLGIDFLTVDFIAVMMIAMVLYCGIVSLLTDK